MGKLDGKVAIVTGAGRGIGRAIAEAYLREGASVTIVAAREQQELDRYLQGPASERALPLVADITNPQDCERIVTQTLQRFGHIDILVNNAGRGMKYVSPSFMTQPTRFWEIQPETWQMIIDTNVNGIFYMTRAVVPSMLNQHSGSIINVSVSYETMKRRGFSPYGPSKAALESASAIWSQELVGEGIRLNILLPGGATNTGMIPPEMSEENRARLIQPEVMAEPAVFLASDESRSINGRRLIATEWNPANPEGKPIVNGIGQ